MPTTPKITLLRALLQGATTMEFLAENRAELGRRCREILATPAAGRTSEQNEELNAALGRQCAILDACSLFPKVRAVLAHAEANRSKGWGVVLDETPLESLCEAIGGSGSAHGAISRVAKVLAVRRNHGYLKNKQAV
jgi:hypothetical protein